MKSKTILITGATGNLGGYLSKSFCSRYTKSKVFNWKPMVSKKEGILKMIEWVDRKVVVCP